MASQGGFTQHSTSYYSSLRAFLENKIYALSGKTAGAHAVQKLGHLGATLQYAETRRKKSQVVNFLFPEVPSNFIFKLPSRYEVLVNLAETQRL